MERRVFLFSATAARALAAPRGPNVVLLVADPLRAAQVVGLRFRRAYAAAPEPRAAAVAIRSGRFPHARGENVLEASLREAGYRIAPADRFADPPFFAFRECGGEGPQPPLDALERSGHAPQTLVIVTAAFGPGGEESPRDDSVRVPLVLRWPGRLANGESDPLISHVDLAPTALALCGIAPPPGLHGRDLSRAILDGSGPRAESVFAYGRLGSPEEWRMVVRGLDKLVVDAKMQPTHLYNLGLDPGEETNLASEAAHQRLRDELTAHTQDWIRRIGYGMDPSGLKVRG